MKTTRKRIVSFAAIAMSMAMIVTGCSADAPADSAGSGSEVVQAADEDQNLTFVPGFAVPALDPTKAPLEMGANQVLSNVLQTLVKLDEKSQPQPQLASSWEWTDDTTLVLKMRENVLFSDGKAFGASDVKGSLDRYIAQNGTLAVPLSVIESIEVPDEATVVIKTKQADGTLLGVLSMLFIGQGDYATDDTWWSKPIGTGAFVIDQFVANDSVVLTRNENYWGEKAKLKTLTFKLITDTNGKVTALSNGQVQVVNNVAFDQVETVKNMDGITFEQFDGFTYAFLWFNNEREPLTDVRVRKAMWHALDLETIVSSLFGETASTMKSYCPVAAFGCVPATDMPKYDPELAKQLLAEAGHESGVTVDVIFSTANVGYDSLIPSMISAWNEVGIKVEPRALDGATWLTEFTALNWDTDVQPNQTATGDADYTLNRLYSCAAKRLGYCNPELDSIFAQAKSSTDADERLTLYQQGVDMMVADAPAIPLYETKPNVAFSDKVQGLTIPPTEFIDWSTVSLTK